MTKLEVCTVADEQIQEPVAEGLTTEAPEGGPEHKPAEDWEQQLLERDNQIKRLAADFENARRRYEQEKEDLVKFASERVLLNLLPVVDNLERALAAARTATEVEPVVQGVELISRQLQDLLNKFGVSPVPAEGQPFDPNVHEAVQQVASDEVPEHTVLEELQKGYLLNGKVIRPALVKVATSV